MWIIRGLSLNKLDRWLEEVVPYGLWSCSSGARTCFIELHRRHDRVHFHPSWNPIMISIGRDETTNGEMRTVRPITLFSVFHGRFLVILGPSCLIAIDVLLFDFFQDTDILCFSSSCCEWERISMLSRRFVWSGCSRPLASTIRSIIDPRSAAQLSQRASTSPIDYPTILLSDARWRSDASRVGETWLVTLLVHQHPLIFVVLFQVLVTFRQRLIILPWSNLCSIDWICPTLNCLDEQQWHRWEMPWLPWTHRSYFRRPFRFGWMIKDSWVKSESVTIFSIDSSRVANRTANAFSKTMTNCLFWMLKRHLIEKAWRSERSFCLGWNIRI